MSNVKVVKIRDAQYPNLLREIYDPPEELFYDGRLPFDTSPLRPSLGLGEGKMVEYERGIPLIAVVGSRKMSQRGREYVELVVPRLVNEGFGIVSGLAYGVDAWAHEVCLRCGGYALAVLPTPLDKIYPRENQELAKKIVMSGGCLMTEFENGRNVLGSDFLRRNRIVSGLCAGVLVIEADLRSGSVATANFALDQGREVWVCPANPGEPNSEGILKLVEDGANLI